MDKEEIDKKRNKDELIVNNLGLVKHFAKKTIQNSKVRNKINYESGYQVNLDDLISAGYEGLILAAEKYDEVKGKFSTYAAYYIKEKIYEEIKKSQEPMIAGSTHNRKERYKKEVSKAIEEIGEINIEKISKKTGLPVRRVENILIELKNPTRLKRIDDINEGLVLRGGTGTCDATEIDRLYYALEEIENELEDGEQIRLILALHYGLDGFEKTTRKEIAERLGLTISEVNNKINRALSEIHDYFKR